MTMTTKTPRRPAGVTVAAEGQGQGQGQGTGPLLAAQEGKGKKKNGRENGRIVPITPQEIEITITPVPSVPDSLEDHGGNPLTLTVEGPLDWRVLTLKLFSIAFLLFLFVCSLGILSDSFRLIAGKAAGEVLQQEKLINNPIVGVMMGIFVTVAVQSSSTSTSIVVSMVASGLLTVKTAIPIIMGANVGTSVTNTVVALTHMTNRADFERAFGGAVLHDMFNLLTVSTLLLVEQLTSYLEITTTKLVELINLEGGKKGGGEIQILSKITKPLTTQIVQINKDVIIGWSINDPKYDDARLLKVWCNSTTNSQEENGQKCKFLFNNFDLTDSQIGIILLIISLIVLCGCLVIIVKVLSSLLKGKLATAVQKVVNANIPYFPCLTGYLAILVGALMTIMVQSSSVFTSAMTPCIALGMISLERAYPLTLGSNLGTTTTAMLAALATEGPNMKYSIQLALCHFLFNLTGILLFYPIPWTRFPIRMARALGRVTAQYRWFAVFYLVFMFFILPLLVFLLSLLGRGAFYCVFIPLGVVAATTLVITFLQNWGVTSPLLQGTFLRDWSFLPLWLRSLEPYDLLVDRLVMTCRLYCPCGGGITGGGITTGAGGMRPNSSQVCFLEGGRSPSSPGGFKVYDNVAFQIQKNATNSGQSSAV